MNNNLFSSPGIPDEDFIREAGVPMTKNEIRVLSLAKLRIFAGAVIYDVGAGSGSVAVECKLMNPAGRVLAIEKDSRALNVMRKNIAKFAVDLEVVEGTAPGCMQNLPEADRIFIGGSGGELEAILDICDKKLKTGGWLVINSVTLKTGPDAYTVLKAKDYYLEAAQVNISTLNQVGNTELWQARNPVTIIAAQKKRGENS